jgi:MFS transporter, DHA1 family, multidrug resistance protein
LRAQLILTCCRWFISVPVVLEILTGFNPRQLGLGFIAAIGGTLLAAISVILIDQVTARTARTKNGMAIEHRMIPAMVGALLNIAAVFWVGWTATPDFDYHIPVVGTAVYVWGSAMTLIAFVSYLFDAFPARGTLISLTAAACARVVSAGWVSLVILISITNIGGNWTYSIFGFIFIAFLPWPFVLYFFGPKIRAKSRLSRNGSNFTPSDVADGN